LGNFDLFFFLVKKFVLISTQRTGILLHLLKIMDLESNICLSKLSEEVRV